VRGEGRKEGRGVAWRCVKDDDDDDDGGDDAWRDAVDDDAQE
jgi:hypothetical protein